MTTLCRHRIGKGYAEQAESKKLVIITMQAWHIGDDPNKHSEIFHLGNAEGLMQAGQLGYGVVSKFDRGVNPGHRINRGVNQGYDLPMCLLVLVTVWTSSMPQWSFRALLSTWYVFCRTILLRAKIWLFSWPLSQFKMSLTNKRSHLSFRGLEMNDSVLLCLRILRWSVLWAWNVWIDQFGDVPSSSTCSRSHITNRDLSNPHVKIIILLVMLGEFAVTKSIIGPENNHGEDYCWHDIIVWFLLD